MRQSLLLCTRQFFAQRTFAKPQKQAFRFVPLLLLVASLVPVRVAAQPARSEGPRHIIICVDGVGISTIKRLRAEGRFQMFEEPSYLISAFPSLTNAAMTEILRPAGAKTTAGYEDTYFDVGANKMRGGIFDRLRGDRFINGTFRELFDYHPSAIKSGLGYAAPPVSTFLEALSDNIRLRQKARHGREQVFFGYTGATDSLSHLGGEKLLRSFLNRLDESVKDLIRDSKEPLTVTIFSDHGNHFRKYQRLKLKSALRKAGFKLEKRIKGESSVVLPQFGLVGCAVLFTNELNEQRLAKVIGPVEGVDFATYEKDGIVYIVSGDGEATIEKRASKYRYRTLTGDPLALTAVNQELTAQGHADADGFIGDEYWYRATCSASRPDIVRRVFEGATEGVNNRANVIVSLKDGYYSGSSLLDVFTILQATHGNAGQEQSYGFLMSTMSNLPLYIRAEDAWETIGSPQLSKAKMIPSIGSNPPTP